MDQRTLKDMEQALDRLRSKYEQYFIGVERQPPEDEHKRLARQIRIAAESHQPNTAIRFRTQNVKARLVTLEQYWNRTLREIENGTYRRHRFRLKVQQEMAEEAQPQSRGAAVVDLEESERASKYGDVIQNYQKLQQKSGQSPADTAKLAKALDKQERQLRKKLGTNKIEFRVVMEDGKPKLKARGRK